jgi:hypothetical protein
MEAEESIDSSIVSQFLYSDIETNVPSAPALQEELSASEQQRKELEAKNNELQKKVWVNV